MAVLEPKFVGNIKGEFLVPDYQRGYRWKEEVAILLKDLSEVKEGADYCLQPIVLKSLGNDKYELIDGQQRLTTLYLLMKYMSQIPVPFTPQFTIDYKTRPGSRQFLCSIDQNMLKDSPKYLDIDCYHILEAYRTIHSYFSDTKKFPTDNDKSVAAFKLCQKLKEHISVSKSGLKTENCTTRLVIS